MKRLLLFLIPLLGACKGFQPHISRAGDMGESRDGLEAECHLRFRAAESVKDSVAVLDKQYWCRDVLPPPPGKQSKLKPIPGRDP